MACKSRVHVTKNKLKKIKCKFFLGIVLTFFTVYCSFTCINWDAAMIFHQPSLDDLEEGFTKEVENLDSSRWLEKRAYVMEIFQLVCANTNYALLTNLNIRILGHKVQESMAYQCQDDKLYVNLRTYPKETGIKLKCNETYGDRWTEKIRSHPLEYSFVIDSERYFYTTSTYEETCMFLQATDLLKGTWKPI